MFTSVGRCLCAQPLAGRAARFATLAALVLGSLVALLEGGFYRMVLACLGGVHFRLRCGAHRCAARVVSVGGGDAGVVHARGVGVERLLVAAPPVGALVPADACAPVVPWHWRRGWGGRTIELFFVRYAGGHGHETPAAMEMRFMEAHCDGRVFYFFGERAAWNGDAALLHRLPDR